MEFCLFNSKIVFKLFQNPIYRKNSLIDRFEKSHDEFKHPRPVIRDDRNFSRGRRQNKRRRVPEHVTNPEKFTKYDLSDVKLRNWKKKFL